jgi:hypothetical protein
MHGSGKSFWKKIDIERPGKMASKNFLVEFADRC